MAELTTLIRVSAGGALRHRFSSFSGQYGRSRKAPKQRCGSVAAILPRPGSLMNGAGARPPPRVRCRAYQCSRCRVGAETWSATIPWRPLCGTPALLCCSLRFNPKFTWKSYPLCRGLGGILLFQVRQNRLAWNSNLPHNAFCGTLLFQVNVAFLCLRF